ncbi:jg17105 [Pararge aegeria aegeria]|uniref:Jg17105 protein n=1 Tax=Pararge aegeria aegeria TaxID=348720 RepID=A0A8S4R0X0_9NEOP|nr:jg17105 [Pararge aegeria aegeria]
MKCDRKVAIKCDRKVTMKCDRKVMMKCYRKVTFKSVLMWINYTKKVSFQVTFYGLAQMSKRAYNIFPAIITYVKSSSRLQIPWEISWGFCFPGI